MLSFQKKLTKTKKNANIRNLMKKVPTVHELRKRGWKVKVGHHRNLHKYNPQTGQKTGKYNVLLSEWKNDSIGNFFLSANGGKTTVSIKLPDSDVELYGEVYCSEDELYNKSVGLKKAIAIALSTLEKTT